MTITIITHLSG